jgi:hypothetical protein
MLNKDMKLGKLNKDDMWVFITYIAMSISICVLMYEVYQLKEEVKTLKEIRIKSK